MRIFLIVLLSLILVPLLMVTSVLGIVNIMFTETFIVETMQEVELFSRLEEMLPAMMEGDSEDEEPQEENPMEHFLPRLDFGNIVQDASETLVGQVFSYLTGDSDAIEITVDLSPIVQQMEDMIMDKDTFIEIMLEMQPELADDIAEASDELIAEKQQEILMDFRAENETGEGIPGEMNVNFIEMMSEDNPEFLDTLGTLRTIYANMKLALWIGVGVCVVFFALMLLLSLTGGLTAAGICMLLVGGPMALTTISAQLAMKRVVSVIADEVPADMLGVVERLLRQFLSVPRNIGLGLIGAAVLFIALAIVVRRAKKRKQARITAVQDADKTTSQYTEAENQLPAGPTESEPVEDAVEDDTETDAEKE